MHNIISCKIRWPVRRTRKYFSRVLSNRYSQNQNATKYKRRDKCLSDINFSVFPYSLHLGFGNGTFLPSFISFTLLFFLCVSLISIHMNITVHTYSKELYITVYMLIFFCSFYCIKICIQWKNSWKCGIVFDLL